jgi:hypothetical protein
VSYGVLHISIFVHPQLHPRTYTCVHINTYTHTYTHTYTQTVPALCMYVCMYVCMEGRARGWRNDDVDVHGGRFLGCIGFVSRLVFRGGVAGVTPQSFNESALFLAGGRD